MILKVICIGKWKWPQLREQNFFEVNAIYQAFRHTSLHPRKKKQLKYINEIKTHISLISFHLIDSIFMNVILLSACSNIIKSFFLWSHFFRVCMYFIWIQFITFEMRLSWCFHYGKLNYESERRWNIFVCMCVFAYISQKLVI